MSDVILTVNEPLYINIEKQNAQVIEGPQGPAGPTGAQGPAGPAGPAGSQGPAGVAGKSAYELAVENGFVGTLPEWLESLEGSSAALQFRNGLRLLAGDFVESGSDSEIDAKGSQLLAHNYIHLNGFSKTFVGSKFGNPSLFTIGADGGLVTKQSSLASYNNSNIWQIDGLKNNNVKFNFFNLNSDNISSNSVFGFGWNLQGGGQIVGGRGAIGVSFEENYEPTLGDDIAEYHLHFYDKNNVEYRLESYTIDKDNPSTWDKYNTIRSFGLKDPVSLRNYFTQSTDGIRSTYRFLDPSSATSKGVEIYSDPSQTIFYLRTVNYNTGNNLWQNQLSFDGFGRIETEGFSMIKYTGTLVFKFKDNLPVFADNAAAIAGGAQLRTVYRTATGELRIVI